VRRKAGRTAARIAPVSLPVSSAAPLKWQRAIAFIMKVPTANHGSALGDALAWLWVSLALTGAPTVRSLLLPPDLGYAGSALDLFLFAALLVALLLLGASTVLIFLSVEFPWSGRPSAAQGSRSLPRFRLRSAPPSSPRGSSQPTRPRPRPPFLPSLSAPPQTRQSHRQAPATAAIHGAALPAPAVPDRGHEVELVLALFLRALAVNMDRERPVASPLRRPII
jgi:hypothetical protein